MTKMIKDGLTGDEVLNKIDNRFLSHEKTHEQLEKLQQVKQQNSGSGRMLNIVGGIVLMLITVTSLIAKEGFFMFYQL